MGATNEINDNETIRSVVVTPFHPRRCASRVVNRQVDPFETTDEEDNFGPPSLPSGQDSDTEGDAGLGGDVESINPDDHSIDQGTVRWNNTQQACHWCATFNNYTLDDPSRIDGALTSAVEESAVLSAIAGKEVGESGAPHLQCHFHFKKKQRQSSVHGVLGHKRPIMHLEAKRRDESAVAAFRCCMKDDECAMHGKDLDAILRAGSKTQAALGKRSKAHSELTADIESGNASSVMEVRERHPELAAANEDHWRGLTVQAMAIPPVPNYPLKPWQQKLFDKLEQPSGDREVIFAMDKPGNCGKTWFTDWCQQEHGKSHTVGADKREDISCELINHIIEVGPLDVMFMDAPRGRVRHVSSPFLEELKNGKIRSVKCKSKTLHLTKRPHVVVMMNEHPRKSHNDPGPSDDRCTYLVISNGDGEWKTDGFHDGGGAFAPDFNPPESRPWCKWLNGSSVISI